MEDYGKTAKIWANLTNDKWKATKLEDGEKYFGCDDAKVEEIYLDDEDPSRVSCMAQKDGFLVSMEFDITDLGQEDMEKLYELLGCYVGNGVYTTTWGFVPDEFIKNNLLLFMDLRIEAEEALEDVKTELYKARFWTKPAKLFKMNKKVDQLTENYEKIYEDVDKINERFEKIFKEEEADVCDV